MARTLRPLDPGAGPVQAFAAELRRIWKEAGQPTFLQMARKTGKSRTAMSEAVGGDVLPTWETVVAFVAACSAGDLNDWRMKWEQARDARASGIAELVNQINPASDQSLAMVESDSSMEIRRKHWIRQASPYIGTVLGAALITCVATVAVVKATTPNSTSTRLTAAPLRTAIITVQNKVALGSGSLVEDTTPAYLSSKPMPSCSRYHCEVPGTQVYSGAMLVAVCYIRGIEMYNYNLDSVTSGNNPNRVSSTLWYKAVFPNGRSGYIAEVYIISADRGGMKLPVCR